ncbi:hypothetical protein QOT17_017911 [Balamuthia mandrillaris]
MGYKRYCSLRKCFQITPSAAGILNQAIFTQIVPPSVIFLHERLYNSTSSPSSGSGSGSSGGGPVMSSMEKLFQGSFLENIPRVVKSSSIIFGKFTSHNTTMDYESIVWLRTMGFMYHLFVNRKTFITIIHGSRNRSFKQNNECTFYWSEATREIAARMVVASHHENLYVISNAFKYVDASNIGLKPVMLMKPIIGNDISLPYIHEKTYHYQHKEPGSSFDEYYFDVLLKNTWALWKYYHPPPTSADLSFHDFCMELAKEIWMMLS